MADNGQIDNVYVNFEVKDNGADDKISKFDEALEKLIATLERIDDKLTGFKDNFKGIESAIGNINIPTEKLEQSASDVEKATQKVKDSVDKIKSIEKGDTASNAFDGIGESAEKAAVSVDYLLSDSAKLEYLTKNLYKARAELGELAQGGAGYENKDVRSLINQINRLQREIDKIDLTHLDKDVAQGFDNASKKVDKFDKSVKKANNSSKNYNKGLRGLLGTAKRFLVFGTFFTIQRQISQAFQEGTQNLYQYSKAIDGNFAQSMDRLTTSFLYMKNAIGAAVAPLINAVTPALESLIDTVAEFGNKLAETFAALTGATTFKKAIKSHKEYAEAVNATNNALAKFDEINNITTSKGDKNQDYGSMFETAEVGQGIDIDGEKFERISSIFGKLKKIWGECKETLKNLLPVLDILLWDWAAPLIDIGLDWLATAWDGLNKVLKAFSDWCVENPETVKFMADVILGFFAGLWAYNTTKNIIDFLGKLPKHFENLKKSIVALTSPTSLLAIGIGTLVAGITVLALNWDKLTPKQRTITILGALAAAATAAAIAIAVFHTSWSVGVAAAAIVGGLSLLGLTFASLQKSSKSATASMTDAKKLFKSTSGNPLKGYAMGGYPASGEMFIARENGIPEMVGSIGGRTAVANNDQIVEAISIGVYNAYMDAMSRSGGNKQPTIVQINGREVFRAVQDESTSYRKRTGQPAF